MKLLVFSPIFVVGINPNTFLKKPSKQLLFDSLGGKA
jgi:hypothetical protein